MLDISVVTYNSTKHIGGLLKSLSECSGLLPHESALYLIDNASTDETLDTIRESLTKYELPIKVEIARNHVNKGFARAHNENIGKGGNPWIFVINPDCEIAPGSFKKLLEEIHSLPDEIAALEVRQSPYEHPKVYNPVTLETSWASAAALFIRRHAYDKVKGFEELFFLYGEDVDLSWRLRGMGYRIKYFPYAIVNHDTYQKAGMIKPAQQIGARIGSLRLRTRFGTGLDVVAGIAFYLCLFFLPSRFSGYKKKLLNNLLRFPSQVKKLRAKRPVGFKPSFYIWNYEKHRKGAFHDSAPLVAEHYPKVSVLVRSIGRADLLRQALCTIANQTYPHIEVVLVEDGAPTCKEIAKEFPSLTIVYESTGERRGRVYTGNSAMQSASGEYLCFLDEDDLWFADHLETLMKKILETGAKFAYSNAFELHGMLPEWKPEKLHCTKLHSFSLPELLIRNYIPINTAIFHKSLPNEVGALSYELDLLEDWNLWVRFAVHTGLFAHAAKTTAIYRVPHSKKERKIRRKKFREQYKKALEQNLLALEKVQGRHTGEARHPEKMPPNWIQASAGMTRLELDLKDRLFIKLIGWLGEKELLGFRSRYPLLIMMELTSRINRAIGKK